jgi:protein-tyrosine phosphatase
MNKIDIHSHILPGLDDGAADELQSLDMLRMAAADGVTDIIATPHFHYRRGHATPEEIREKIRYMQDILRTEGIPITLHEGNELYYTHELLETVKAGEALTLAGSDYALLEFSPETERRKIQNAVYQFLSEGYYPIIAHMERYQAFQKHGDFVGAIADMGAYYQVNIGSLLGNSGWSTKRFTKIMLNSGMVQFVATDAHDEKVRAPHFGKGPDWLEKKLGAADANRLLYENPKMIIENKGI